VMRWEGGRGECPMGKKLLRSDLEGAFPPSLPSALSTLLTHHSEFHSTRPVEKLQHEITKDLGVGSGGPVRATGGREGGKEGGRKEGCGCV